jgi:hypothetical protein
MNSNFLTEKLLEHLIGYPTYGQSSNIWMGLFTEAPSVAGGGTEAVGYTRVAIKGALGIPSIGSIRNISPIAMQPANQDLVDIEALGFFDAQEGGNLLGHVLVRPFSVPEGQSLRWGVGKLSFSYLQEPKRISFWEQRPLDVYEGYLLVFEPTGVLYRYSEQTKDYVRNDFYESFHFELKSELSGNHLPLEEPDYPWDNIGGSMTDPDTKWSIFNDGNHNWVQFNTIGFSGSSFFRKNLGDNPQGNYFSQGYVWVPQVSGASSQRSAMWITRGHNEESRLNWTFSGHTGVHQNRISHMGDFTPAGRHLYVSPTTNNNQVWFEIYVKRDVDDPSNFVSLVYINHAKEPCNYFDQSMTTAQTYTEVEVRLGDISGSATSLTRFRDFKVGNMWRK